VEVKYHPWRLRTYPFQSQGQISPPNSAGSWRLGLGIHLEHHRSAWQGPKDETQQAMWEQIPLEGAVAVVPEVEQFRQTADTAAAVSGHLRLYAPAVAVDRQSIDPSYPLYMDQSSGARHSPPEAARRHIAANSHFLVQGAGLSAVQHWGRASAADRRRLDRVVGILAVQGVCFCLRLCLCSRVLSVVVLAWTPESVSVMD
jgi:hypothetical protein